MNSALILSSRVLHGCRRPGEGRKESEAARVWIHPFRDSACFAGGGGGGDSKDTSEATSPFQLRLSQPQAGGAEFQRKQAALPAKAAPPLEKADSFGPNAVPK